MRKGFTLIEVLLVLLLLPLILTLSIGVLSLMKVDLESMDDQYEVFKLQFRYLMQTVGQINIQDNQLHYTYDNQNYWIEFDKNRLVKRPGYEILLYDVESLSNEGGCLRLVYKEESICLDQ